MLELVVVSVDFLQDLTVVNKLQAPPIPSSPLPAESQGCALSPRINYKRKWGH